MTILVFMLAYTYLIRYRDKSHSSENLKFKFEISNISTKPVELEIPLLISRPTDTTVCKLVNKELNITERMGSDISGEIPAVRAPEDFHALLVCLTDSADSQTVFEIIASTKCGYICKYKRDTKPPSAM